MNIQKIDIKDLNNDNALKYIASTYDRNNNILRDGIIHSGKRVITFSNILQHKTFPLAEILSTLLEIGQREMNNPIEIEFAVNLETPAGTPKIFNFLQIRPIVHTEETHTINIDHIKKEDTIIYSESALGNGVFKGIHDLVYIKPESFNAANNKSVAIEIEKLILCLLKRVKDIFLLDREDGDQLIHGWEYRLNGNRFQQPG